MEGHATRHKRRLKIKDDQVWFTFFILIFIDIAVLTSTFIGKMSIVNIKMSKSRKSETMETDL